MQKSQKNNDYQKNKVYIITYCGSSNPIKITLPLLTQQKTTKYIGVSCASVQSKPTIQTQLTQPMVIRVQVKQLCDIHNEKGTKHGLVCVLSPVLCQKYINSWQYTDSDPDLIRIDDVAQAVQLKLIDEKGQDLNMDQDGRVFSLKLVLCEK